MGEFSAWHLLILAGVFVLLFGAKRLPDGARSLGRSLRIFKTEVKGLGDEDKNPNDATPAALSAGQAAPQAAPGATTAAPVDTPPAAPVAAPPSAPVATPPVDPASAAQQQHEAR